ncbi:MAG: hypothetical protein OEQ81_11720 [Flavobacteriaceae bacterium]|nr:hypothetical protein [Flavobacteriaceae bacterium]
MPIELILETYGQHWICSGHVTSAEISSTNKLSLKAAEEHNHWYTLIDFNEAEELVMDDLDIVDVSIEDAAFSRKHPNLKLAVVVNKAHLKEKLMKYLMVSWALNSNWEFRVYDTVEAARDWFNVQDP